MKERVAGSLFILKKGKSLVLLWVKKFRHHGSQKIAGVKASHSRRHGETKLVF